MFERSSYEKDIKKHDQIFSNTGSDAVSLCLCAKATNGNGNRRTEYKHR